MDVIPLLAAEQPGGQGPHVRGPTEPVGVLLLRPGPWERRSFICKLAIKIPAMVYFNSPLSFWEWNRIVNLVVGQGRPALRLARNPLLVFLPDGKGGK